MKIIYFIILLNIIFSSAHAYEYGSNLSEPCKKDSDCILFEDECGLLNSFIKSKLPKATEAKVKMGLKYFTWKKENLPTCDKKFFAKPEWPKNPNAKCVKTTCAVL